MQKTYLGQLKILFSALAAGQIGFFSIAYLVHNLKPGDLADASMVLAMSIALTIVTLSGISMSFFLYQLKVKAAKDKEDPKSKLDEYRIACILRWALLEFPSMLGIALFFIAGNFYLLLSPGICFLLFLNARPDRDKIKSILDLSEGEAEDLVGS